MRVYIEIDDLVFFLGPGPGVRSWCFMISVKRVERIKKGIKRQKGGREKGTFRGICMSPLNVLNVWVSDLYWDLGQTALQCMYASSSIIIITGIGSLSSLDHFDHHHDTVLFFCGDLS